MAATPITKTKRYFARGITRCYFLEAVEDYQSGPSRSELDAGMDLTEEIAEIEGWGVSSNNIETPDLGRRFTPTIPGSIEADESSITFYASLTGEDVREVLPRDTEGYIVWLDAGDTPGAPMDVFPVRVSSVGKPRSLDDEAQILTINFAIIDEPVENLEIPAA